MTVEPAPAPRGAIERLRRFAPRRPAAEPCDLCAAALAAEHQHLLEPEQRRLLCVCAACATLFGEAPAADGVPADRAQARYRRVPRRIERLEQFAISDAEWDGLLIPIGLAFFFYSTPIGRVVALYPSPAGATESLLPLSTWQELGDRNPVLRGLLPDVEALLVHRLGRTREYYRAPIDECYALVGLLRRRWRGLSGGTEVWQELERFFLRLRQRATRRGGEADA
jgi:hypothetical protein